MILLIPVSLAAASDGAADSTDASGDAALAGAEAAGADAAPGVAAPGGAAGVEQAAMTTVRTAIVASRPTSRECSPISRAPIACAPPQTAGGARRSRA